MKRFQSNSQSVVRFILWLIAACTALAQLTYAASPVMPKFVARYDLPGCAAYPGDVATADVNGDGIPDIICTGNGNVTTFLGNGNGFYYTGPVSNIGYNVVGALAPSDLNGDGKVDLIALAVPDCCIPNGFVVTLGNGDGTFQSGTFYPTQNNLINTTYIVTGDFNGDGTPDFVTETESGLYLALGTGGGAFSPAVNIPLNFYGEGRIAAVDLNDDGKLDLIASVGEGFAVLLGNGDGTFQPEIDKAVPFSPTDFTLGDFDGDGKVDLFVSCGLSAKGYLYLGEGNGRFHFAIDRIVDIGLSRAILASADVNGDGFLDIATSAGQVFFGNGHGQFSPPTTQPLSLPQLGGDVLPVMSSQNGPVNLVFGGSVLRNNGKGGFPQVAAVALQGGGARCAVSGDFNRDGIPDLAVGGDFGLSILLGTGETSAPYTQGQEISYDYWSCPVKGDLNGDGKPDLLVTTSEKLVVAYLGNGDGTFSAVANNTPIAVNGDLALGDFNGDGIIDFALTSNLLAYGNGDGTFQTPRPFIPKLISRRISGIASARLRSAATSDIVLTDSSANLVYVLLNNDGAFKQTTFTPQQCPGPANPTLADINGDGTRDIVLGCNGSTAPIYLNDGEGVFTFGTAVTFSVPAYAGYPLITDLNGDGIPDLVIQSNYDLIIFTGQGGLLFAPPFYVSAGSSAGPVLALDAQGQKLQTGKPDLITPGYPIINGQYSGAVNVFFNVTK